MYNHPPTHGSMQISFPLYVNVIQMIFTEVLGGVSVPLFFVISTYLFFAKPKSTKENIKSKFKSIVVPYIFWTVLTIFLYFAAQSFSFSRNYFSANKISCWTFSAFLFLCDSYSNFTQDCRSCCFFAHKFHNSSFCKSRRKFF